jgi:hypothetical protein
VVVEGELQYLGYQEWKEQFKIWRFVTGGNGSFLKALGSLRLLGELSKSIELDKAAAIAVMSLMQK